MSLYSPSPYSLFCPSSSIFRVIHYPYFCFMVPDDLKDPLDQYVARHLPIVTVVRLTRREGLIRARLLGARHATGMVLTFLDSHCEVNRDWLVPLLTRLREKPTEAVVPVIDVINHQSLAYTWVGLNKGGFDWGLSFKWHPLNEHSWNDNHQKVQPFRYDISVIMWHHVMSVIITDPPLWPEGCSVYTEIISLLLVPMTMAWTFGEGRTLRSHWGYDH